MNCIFFEAQSGRFDFRCDQLHIGSKGWDGKAEEGYGNSLFGAARHME